MLLATNRGRQRSVVAPRTFRGEVGALLLSFQPGTHAHAHTFSGVPALFCVDRRFITVRFDEGLTPRHKLASVSRRRAKKEDQVKTSFLFGELSGRWPVS